MPANLARVGVTVFALLFAIAIVTEHPAAARGLAPAAPAALPDYFDYFAMDGPPVVAGLQSVPDTEPAPAQEADAIVIASWYGPGFYGNRTACGQLFTPGIIGVAHQTLPCGTLLTLQYGDRVMTVPVIDRGPYVVGRTIDLSSATKQALGCTDLCTLRMQVLR